MPLLAFPNSWPPFSLTVASCTYETIFHVAIGKKSFGAEKLFDNFNVIFDAIVKAKPAAAKGQYIKSVSVSSTMGPGLKVAVKQ